MRSQYTVEISLTDNGFFVKCGCISLVYTEPSKLLRLLEDWFNEPQRTEKEYIDRYMHERLQPAEPPYRQYETAKSAIPRDMTGAIRSETRAVEEAEAIRSGYEGDNAPPRIR